MAAKKMSGLELGKVHGLSKMVEYAKKHGFEVFDETYKIVKKHKKQRMKDIDVYGRKRISSPPQMEYCEVVKVRGKAKGKRKSFFGYLIGYPNGIRFDSHERY